VRGIVEAVSVGTSAGDRASGIEHASNALLPRAPGDHITRSNQIVGKAAPMAAGALAKRPMGCEADLVGGTPPNPPTRSAGLVSCEDKCSKKTLGQWARRDPGAAREAYMQEKTIGLLNASDGIVLVSSN